MNTITIPGLNPWILVLIVIWTIPWKGVALWKAARLSHKSWFIVLLILNTVGILEIIYIFLVARKYSVETIDKPDVVPAPMPEMKPLPEKTKIPSMPEVKKTETETMTQPNKELSEDGEKSGLEK